MDKDKLSCWLKRWNLIPDGTPFHTHTSQLLPVKTAADGAEAMLKVTADRDEQTGTRCWSGGQAGARRRLLPMKMKPFFSPGPPAPRH